MSGTKDYASPALSLSLAGVFRNAARAEEEVEEGDEESGGGGCRGETVDISSENTGTGRSEQDGDDDDEELPEEDGEVSKGKNKKRKKYHRHTVDQIKEMEGLFKESPHPDEKQRQQLSKRLGLAPRQVKFWFQNRRTQIKAMQERHENSLLKSEMEKLREENRNMRETINKACCPNCGSLTTYKDATKTTEVQQLRLENSRLKAEIEKLRVGKVPQGTTASSSSCSTPGKDQENRSSLDYYSGFFGVDKPKILEIVNLAMDELMKMATAREPLWVRSLESGREILNYDEYVGEFSPRSSNDGRVRRSIEASRETGVVILDISRLVQSFIDVNEWKDMFPGTISKAATVDIISNGESGNGNGVVQLMFAELQMLTPMVPTREVYFIRHCKQHSPDIWAVVDVSIDAIEHNIDASLVKCKKLPSGCVIEDKANGHCKVTWVEHMECQRGTVHTMYRPIVNSGLAFGAWHWMATLQQQCERMVFFMATNVPTKDSNGVSTLAGRKSTMKLAQRMTSNFCYAVGASSYHTWTKMSTKNGDDLRISSRKNLNDPGEPVGIILCAVSSVWLPVSASAMFDFLRDETRRSEWDVLLTGGTAQTIASIAKGQHRGNSVTLHAVQSRDNSEKWFLQDSCTNAFESMVVFAPVDMSGMQSVMSGCDSGSVAILPSGFSILPDGLDASPPVITSRREEKPAEGGGSLLTVALQVVANASPAAKLTMESVEAVNSLVSSTLQSIKKSMQCEEG
uniref:Homeobox-leucine zipper protein GLABRA 2 n=1 Tax=Anthurium amnicola TaxID=1678845 RepID=A0A1D1Y8Q0_9ARAE